MQRVIMIFPELGKSGRDHLGKSGEMLSVDESTGKTQVAYVSESGQYAGKRASILAASNHRKDSLMHAALFSAAFGALYVGHSLGDFWAQRGSQVINKGRRGWSGRLACASHVATLTAIMGALVIATALITHMPVHPAMLAAGLAINAVTHYVADRRAPLQRFADLIGKGEFWHLGAPRPGRDDNPTVGTGAFHLDQAWHLGWIWVAALIIAA